MTHLYPIYVNLEQKDCVVIGGGKVAERKIETLLEYGAHISVISPFVEPGIEHWAKQGLIGLKRTEFSPIHIEHAFLVFIATNDTALNKQVAMLCRERNILVNAVDDPPNCDFYVPSVLRRQSLSVAISTEGKSPSFAAKLRQELDNHIPDEYGDFVELLGEVRETIKYSGLDIEERKKLFYRLVDSDISDLIKQGDKQKAEERIKQCISSWQE
ncbi:MAG: bifunctional precorrin-2 dehydrogenase/sirohydrochlorin ferrochelatase [Bacillota bacterium]|nr:bifunctional precorrin-2 dehydrogenase/sirohydrochlorin ferrochelatase [Bacillota bacterium]